MRLVVALVPVDHSLDTESAPNSLSSIRAHLDATGRLQGETPQGVGKGGRVVTGEKFAVQSIPNDLGIATDPRGHYRPTGGHRFQQSIGHSLAS